jgi:O-methyltransferase
VFFDCDLYQPACDTLDFFWSKLSKGGLFLLHDYFYEPGGFSGVKKAVDEFSKLKNIESFPIWETTMVVLRK